MLGRRIRIVAVALLALPACIANIQVDAQLGTDGDVTTTAGGVTSSSTGDPALDVGDPGGQCDPTNQSTCPAGEKCTAWANDGGTAWNDNICVPLDPNPVQPGDECFVEGNGSSGLDNCDAGSLCWNVDPNTNLGTCVAFCEPDFQCGDPGQSCLVFNDGVLPLCMPGCHPLDDPCPAAEVCVQDPMGDAFICVPDASGDQGQVGDPCEYLNVCDPGLYCAPVDTVPDCGSTQGCCTEHCDLTMPTCSQAGTECAEFFEPGMAPPGYEDLGGCVLP